MDTSIWTWAFSLRLTLSDCSYFLFNITILNILILRRKILKFLFFYDWVILISEEIFLKLALDVTGVTIYIRGFHVMAQWGEILVVTSCGRSFLCWSFLLFGRLSSWKEKQMFRSSRILSALLNSVRWKSYSNFTKKIVSVIYFITIKFSLSY